MTTADGPAVNPDRFRIGPRRAVSAIVPAAQVDDCVASLVAAEFPAATIEILLGEAGRESLDITGAHHGVRGRLIRGVQLAGSVHSEMVNYDAALRDGLAVIVVSVADRTRALEGADILQAHGGERIYRYGSWGSQTEWL